MSSSSGGVRPPLEFRLLGRFEVRRADTVLSDGGGKPQALLAALLASANRPVRSTSLASAIWGDQQPPSAANLVQGYVSYWRRLLDPGRSSRARGDRITSVAGGYRLRVGPDECDLLRFTRRSRQAREAVALGDLYTARRMMKAALHEWRGPALGDFATPSLADAAARLETERLELLVAAADIELRLGRPGVALTHLLTLPGEEQLREEATVLMMLALYRLGRQSDALSAFERTRTALAEELGERPGPELAKMHVDVLRRSRALQGGHEDASQAALPARLSSFVGREELQDTVVDPRARAGARPGARSRSTLALHARGSRRKARGDLTAREVHEAGPGGSPGPA